MILVTGATGNIGSEVVRLLHRTGERVRILARNPGKVANVGEQFEVVSGDLNQSETLPPALAGVTKLFLMAHAESPPEIAGRVLRAAPGSPLRHVVLISSSTIYLEPSEPPSPRKLASRADAKLTR